MVSSSPISSRPGPRNILHLVPVSFAARVSFPFRAAGRPRPQLNSAASVFFHWLLLIWRARQCLVSSGMTGLLPYREWQNP
jgi:hypothetical protein